MCLALDPTDNDSGALPDDYLSPKILTELFCYKLLFQLDEVHLIVFCMDLRQT